LILLVCGALLLLQYGVTFRESRVAKLVMVLLMSGFAAAFNWSFFRRRAGLGVRRREALGAFALAVAAVGGWLMIAGRDVTGALLVLASLVPLGFAAFSESREGHEPPE
jgi:hypothetical protein